MSILSWIQSADEVCAQWAFAVRSSPVNNLMIFFARLGDYGCIWLCTAAVLILRGRWRERGIRMLFCFVLCLAINNLILKNIITRPRPFTTLPWLTTLIPPPSDFSFPSGHTATAFVSAVALLNGFGWRTGLPVLILAAIIAFSRFFVGVHYVSDIVSGAFVGIICGSPGWRLSNVLHFSRFTE